MSKKIKFELNYAGVGKLLKSSEMQKVLKEYGETVLNNCEQGSTPSTEYALSVKAGGTRASAKIYAATPKAVRSNAKHNTLLKALGGGS